MGFWGIEVKPGKAYPYHSDNVRGRLHVTQATLGLGSSKERSIVQCSIGHKSPIFLCSLLPNKNESCPLNLEYEDGDDLVAFSVIGERSVHLSGYFESDEGDEIRDDYDSDPFGEDIADTESDSSEYNSSDDYDDEFIDSDDLEMYSPRSSSPVPNSGVVIEEIVDDEKPAHGNGQFKRPKKNQSNGSKDKTNSQIVVRGDTSVPVLQSEDEDGFPISNKQKGKSNVPKPDAEMKPTDDKTTEKSKKKKAQDGDNAANLKRKVENVGQEDRQEKQKKKMKKKQLTEQVQDESADELANEKNHNVEMDLASHDNQSEEEKKKKKKKKNKKKQEIEGGTNADQAASAQENQRVSTLDSEPEAKSSKVRTFANGLVIEDIAMGKPDGKRASPGKTVSVRYTGKLQKNGKIFDSNVGRAPFKFRLGLGQVISGWDVGVNGMRVGDKRKLTIPPAMGYGHKGAGGVIPPNAWLVFDVELIDVR